MKGQQQKQQEIQQQPQFDYNVLTQYQVPKDGDGYSWSFSLDQFDETAMVAAGNNVQNNPQEFFNRFGFVVVRDVLTGDDCDRTVSEIFDIIESKSPRFKRNDRSTWDHFPTEESIMQYGSPSRPPIFTRQFLMNRQNPRVYRVFAELLKNPDLMVNNDRCCFFRPTVNTPGVALGKPEWSTKSNVHLDMNPFNWMGDGSMCRQELDRLRYDRLGEFIQENNQPSQHDGRQLQAVLNLLENHEEDGGYVVVPGFMNHFVDYFNTKKPEYSQPSWNWQTKDPLFKFAKRISMRKGSMVIWDQRMPHGSFNNTSSNPRMAQFIKIYPTSTVSNDRYKSRAAVVSNILASFSDPFPLTKLGAGLFGVKERGLPTVD
ncbi:hypothetical protein SAMD00019534_038080 [Acytostelium subglobosum LB1]|uniref:hypothetical protein n=1 Tax=Acytostelium subglobosum LB1 TaxID=1410327 RepID=UPI000644956D|nr:hypothetical protein SAMD00019534_038080 [Acytostelium subglobosum LB1]GAM20633.1 hypothetical protein SAMD00019534_038080 [Acytostelium subglobosum LB1]|eukprot:XP_012760154.1 hypothetical protein SAMD00019534_038080 [Acytostelium subglobosum LB1]